MLADSSTCKIVRRRKMEVDEQGIMNGSDQRNNCKFPVKWEPKIQNSNSKLYIYVNYIFVYMLEAAIKRQTVRPSTAPRLWVG